MRIYNSITTEEAETLRRIYAISNNHRLTNLLMTITGIAEFSALMIVSEIADITRFKTPKQLVMYAGLCPGIYQTGETIRDVANNAINKHLKWIVTECAGRASTLKGARFQEHFAKINKHKGYQVARRSTARKMLIIIWHMLTKKEVYHTS